MQFSVRVRNRRLDAIELEIGIAPILRIRTGAAPKNCNSFDTGIAIASLQLPLSAFENAKNGAKIKRDTWDKLSVDATGRAGHFRIYKSDGVTCEVQGSVTITDGGGDMTVDNPELVKGQRCIVTGFKLTDGNA